MKLVLGILLLIFSISVFALGSAQKAEDAATQDGIDKAAFLKEFYGLDVPPEQARLININVTLTDVSIEASSISVWLPEELKEYRKK